MRNGKINLQIKIVNGVILVSWRQEILERQIDFGAQLGQVVIELARMELYNFYRNVMPVAEYFDQSGMLIEVSKLCTFYELIEGQANFLQI